MARSELCHDVTSDGAGLYRNSSKNRSASRVAMRLDRVADELLGGALVEVHRPTWLEGGVGVRRRRQRPLPQPVRARATLRRPSSANPLGKHRAFQGRQ